MLTLFLLAIILQTIVDVSASTLRPPVLPLLVRNPYLSAWLPNARQKPWDNNPQFYTGQDLGMTILAIAAGNSTVYPLLGTGHQLLSKESFHVSVPSYTGADFDASTTNLSYTLPKTADRDEIHIVLSFLSPVTPTSTLRQALPASYLAIHVSGDHEISVYVDITGEWITGLSSAEVEWDLQHDTSKDVESAANPKTFKIQRRQEQVFQEFNDRAEWGTLHFSGPTETDHQCGSALEVRQEFARTSRLRDKVDASPGLINASDTVFAFSKSFGSGTSDQNGTGYFNEKAVFTIAHTQDVVAQFASARGLTFMKPLWAWYFQDEYAMLKFHYNDYETARDLAATYSEQLALDALQSGAEDYKDIVALSARQVMGATSFSGTPDDPILFLKEISSNGDFQTVDVIFPAFPFFLYTNPMWLAYLLQPLIEHQLSGQYPRNYSMHDLGTFPNATGYPTGQDEYMPVEECGNMLIMGLALVNAFKGQSKSSNHDYTKERQIPLSADPGPVFPLKVDEDFIDVKTQANAYVQAKKWLKRSYKLWPQWTGYLVREALIPDTQLSTDDFAGWLANQTNLALKGVIGIRAMSELAYTVGDDEAAASYLNISENYIRRWEEYGISRDGTHAKVAYTWHGSWTTLYNLYSDAILCFHLPAEHSKHHTHSSKTTFIKDRIYSMQSTWYHNVRQRYGLPLDSRHLYTKSDWEFFAMAVSSKKVRGEVMQSIAKWINETSTDRPLTDLYDTEGTGGFPRGDDQNTITFKARPVVGGHFSFLALERACGGKAMDGLKFLDEREEQELDVEIILQNEIEEQ